MLSQVQYHILTRFFPVQQDVAVEVSYQRSSHLTALMGKDFVRQIADKHVLDFGCGEGADAIEMARSGARHVTGVDIRQDVLDRGSRRASREGIDNVTFTTNCTETADVVVSVDAFEHFSDPAEILRIISGLLAPSGKVMISFGPTWLHPLGGHLFSVFPWAHLLFSEKALLRWRSTFKRDGAERFEDIAGGLNRMTITRFERLIAASPFQIERLELVPIRKLERLHCRWTREITTAIVRCTLVHKL